MNIGQAFSFPFQDNDWVKKVGLMALISLIPILGQIIVLGWSLEIARRVIRRHPVPLPDIDLGSHLTLGFKAFLTGLVFAIPIFIIQVPTILLSEALQRSNGNTDASTAAALIITVCCSGLLILYAIAMSLILPAAYGNLAAKDSLSAALDFRTVLGLFRAAPAAYLLVLVGIFAASFLMFIGLLACFIGVFIANIYSMAVMGHLYGQAYNQATGVDAGPVQVV